MAISHLYASTIIRVQVHFGFSNFICDPAEITSALGIAPDEIGRKGEVKANRGGREIRWPFNVWTISSRTSSKDVNDHLRELLTQLVGVELRIGNEFGTPSFSVFFKANSLRSGNGPYFESDVIAGIAALHAELWQDIYQVDDPEDQ